MSKQQLIAAIENRRAELLAEIERNREHVEDDRINQLIEQQREQRLQEMQKAPKLDTKPRNEVIELPKFLRTWRDEAEVEQRRRQR